jgi:hypothetical protein
MRKTALKWLKSLLCFIRKNPFGILFLPIIATHIIPLPLPASFIVFVALPLSLAGFLTRILNTSSNSLMFGAIFIGIEIIIYTTLVFICIPLSEKILNILDRLVLVLEENSKN